MISSSSRLLINENPLQVLPSLAVALKNINEAIILQQVQYWVNRSENEYGGRKWVYNTIDQWKDQFPWLSERAIRTRFNSLIKKGVIITSNFNRAKFDRTKWYTIDYDKLNSLIENQNNVENLDMTHSEESSESKRKKVTDATGRKIQIQAEESYALDPEETSGPIPENTIDYSETNTENTVFRSSASADEPVSQFQKVSLTQIIEKEFEQLWALYPRKLGKSKALKKYAAWRKKSKSNTYDVMKAYLNKYLKYIELNQISSQYIIAGYKWFADRFDDELDLSTSQKSNIQNNYRQTKTVHKARDWNAYAAEHANTKSDRKLSDEELKQIFKEYSHSAESEDKSDPHDDKSAKAEVENEQFNLADIELSEDIRQLYHDLGIDF